ncbi:SWIM-type domain-containing protein, partial [Aphis craccivora]
SRFIACAPTSAIALHRLGRQLPGNASVLIQNDNLQLTNLTLTTHLLLKKLKNYPVINMGDCCKKVFSSLSVDTMDILNRSQRYKTFWESCRQFRITGSRCYGLYTYHKTPKTDAKWSLKASRYLWPKSFTNKFVKHGIQYESDAKNVYIKNTNQTVLECGLVTNPSKTSTISDLINDLKYIIKNQDVSFDEMFCKTMLNNLKIVYFERLLHE